MKSLTKLILILCLMSALPSYATAYCPAYPSSDCWDTGHHMQGYEYNLHARLSSYGNQFVPSWFVQNGVVVYLVIDGWFTYSGFSNITGRWRTLDKNTGITQAYGHLASPGSFISNYPSTTSATSGFKLIDDVTGQVSFTFNTSGAMSYYPGGIPGSGNQNNVVSFHNVVPGPGVGVLNSGYLVWSWSPAPFAADSCFDSSHGGCTPSSVYPTWGP